MRKLRALIAMILFLIASGASAQVYEDSKFLFDAYYGFPNLSSALVREAYKDAQSIGFNEEVRIRSIGPLGVKAEYLLSKRIGLGIHFNYANTTASATLGTAGYSYSASFVRWRLLPTFNIHMGSSKKVDPYFSFGAGYLNAKFIEKTNDPLFNFGSIGLKIPVNFAARVEFGVRYFITDHFGIAANFGLGGGALLGAGTAFKF